LQRHRHTCTQRATDRCIGYTSHKEEYLEGQGDSYRKGGARTQRNRERNIRATYPEADADTEVHREVDSRGF
jgi:hypothetical protein